MHEKSHDLSLLGVGLGAVGTFSQQLVLSIVGFALTLIVHFLTGSKKKGPDPELAYWQDRAKWLQTEIEELKHEVFELRHPHEPAALVLPFRPAEAVADCPNDDLD